MMIPLALCLMYRRRNPSRFSTLEDALQSAVTRKKNILHICRLLRKKLLWQSRRRRKLNNESRLEQKRKLPKRLKKTGLETSAKQMMMMRVNGDKKKKVKKKAKLHTYGNRVIGCLPSVRDSEEVVCLLLPSIQALFLLDLCGSEMKARLNGF